MPLTLTRTMLIVLLLVSSVLCSVAATALAWFNPDLLAARIALAERDARIATLEREGAEKDRLALAKLRAMDEIRIQVEKRMAREKASPLPP